MALQLALLLAGQPAWAGPAPLKVQTRYFPFEDQRYLNRYERLSGAVLLPDVDSAVRLPLIVLLHGVNPGGELHLWLGGGARDLRPLATSLMQSAKVTPFVLAAPSQTRAARSADSLWEGFDLGSFVQAVADASAGAVEIDREHVVLMGHSGAGCNPSGGLASAFWADGTPIPRALVSIDPCLDAEMGTAMSKRPASVPLLLWWQSVIWPRDPLAFWAALTLNDDGQRIDRMQELEVAGVNPHEAIVPVAFERSVRELFAPPLSDKAD